MTAAEVDAALTGPALVYGSLPPAGRDLDLLVPEGRDGALGADLEERGWVRSGGTLARFSACAAYAVDLVALEEWAPSADVARALVEQSEPLEGYRWLRAPAEHHRLLVLLRRTARGLPVARKRSALEAFGPQSWGRAEQEAGAWGLTAELDRVRAVLTGQEDVARAPARRRRTLVVAVSGLDGAGKSTHAEHLSAALARLGVEAEVHWTKIARDPVLHRVSRPVRAVLARLPGGRAPTAPEADLVDADGERRNHPDGPPPAPDAARALRQRSRVLTWGWTLVVAWANATTHRRTVRASAAQVVVCDRYVLDSLAHLRYRYGSERRFLLQGLLVRGASPRPVCAFFLDVAPEVARARKPEQYTTADLRRLRALYQQEADRAGAVVVDAGRPVEQVCAELAHAVWWGLEQRAARRRRLPWTWTDRVLPVVARAARGRVPLKQMTKGDDTIVRGKW